ncbi:MAG: DsbC family protein [Proteobacteria bacterium]|nr:DsbC family protein [Pseudomonadota bacterium]MBU1738324.1 DsbC family protein [Pseudomonadota bacterium]
MNRKLTIAFAACLLAFFYQCCVAQAFTADGCGAGSCRDCHILGKNEAAVLLSMPEEQIVDLKLAEVPGLWEVDVRQRQQVIPVFIDFSKQYLINGAVIKIADKQDITRERFADLNRIDVSLIPLDDALIVGKPDAPIKIIVFDDPQCPYCLKLHAEMKRVVGQRPDMAFFIKMFPLKSHPEAYERAKAIICAKSLVMLEESLAGKNIAPPDCETDQVDKNLELAARLGISSTPTLVLPDGRVMPGYKSAEEIIRLLEKPISKEKNIGK